MTAAGVARQSLVKPCLLLLAGGLAAQHSTLLFPSDVLSLLLVASVVALLMRRARACACLATGFALFQLAGAAVVEARLDPIYAGDSMLAVVRVADFPKNNGETATMSVVPIDDPRIPARVRLSWYQPPVMPAIGEVWELELRLRVPRGSTNPGGFDSETWLFREKYHATGYVVEGKRNRLLWSGTASRADEGRARFVARAMMAANTPESGAVLAAIGVGARHHMSREQWDRYARTGTTHLMAISGLHVGLAALVGFVIVFAGSLFVPLRANAYVVAILAGVGVATLYALVSGFGIPARRAVLMLALTALTVACRRRALPWSIVVLAATAVFVTDPVGTLAPGFNLSFAAVILLIWLAQRADILRAGILQTMRRLVTMQVFLLFGLLPLTVLLFGRFAVMSTPVNLAAVPVFSFITVPLTLAGLALGDVSEDVAMFCLRIAAASVDGLEILIGVAAKVSFPGDRLAQFSGLAMLLLLLPLAWVVLPRGWPLRHAALIGTAAVIAWKPGPPPADCFDAWVLDVGQGLAVVVQTHRDVLLYDTGMAWRGGGSAAEYVVLPFFEARGIRHIARLVVSHGDLDHAGGVAYVRENLEVDHVIVGESVEGVNGWRCARGQRWWSGPVLFEVLHPKQSSRSDGNDASCVLRVSVGAHALLLTGDIEVPAERSLLQLAAPLGADVAVIPHHGSLTSSSVPFVDAVNPLVAIVSAAHANRWGFPRLPVVGRWQAVGAEVFNTARDGAVFTRICADSGIDFIRTERERRRRFWHAID